MTRVAFWRGRQLSGRVVHTFQRAIHADGAKESGLTALTYAVMLNYASSATMAVGLANTLFFSAATSASHTKVALYLLITVAPFALIAPVIGPALDRVQRGRRFALAVASVGQGLLCVFMAFHLNDWMLYPAALGTMVLSKSFDVLRAALAPRVLPSGITLSKINARLTADGGSALPDAVVARSLKNVSFSVDPLASTFPVQLKHAVAAGLAKNAKLNGLFDINSCLNCHAQAERFRAVEAHRPPDVQEALMSGEMSCAGLCHPAAHPESALGGGTPAS